jgi:hypothetical protein
MELRKVLKKGDVPLEIAKTAILHEHNLTKFLTKKDLKNWTKVNFTLTAESAKLVRKWAKKLKVSEESILYATTLQYVKEQLGNEEVGY